MHLSRTSSCRMSPCRGSGVEGRSGIVRQAEASVHDSFTIERHIWTFYWKYLTFNNKIRGRKWTQELFVDNIQWERWNKVLSKWWFGGWFLWMFCLLFFKPDNFLHGTWNVNENFMATFVVMEQKGGSPFFHLVLWVTH